MNKSCEYCQYNGPYGSIINPLVYGRWIEYQIPHVICCSNCDWATDAAEKNFQYCPMCGAKMDGDSNALD